MTESIEVVASAVLIYVAIGFVLTCAILLVKKQFLPSSTCVIKINNDRELDKEVDSGTTLLAALLKEGIAVPSPCGGKATCKQCKVRVLEGGGESLETDKATFSFKELKEGWRLSCQCKVKEDVSIVLPDALLTLKQFQGEVVSNKNVATFIKELVVKIRKEDNFTYAPGDYLQMYVPPFKTNTQDWEIEREYVKDWELFGMLGRLIDFTDLEKGEVMRAYSLASYPKEPLLKFNIRIACPPIKKGCVSKGVAWGICSSYAFSLKAGDKIELSGPFGESHMIDDEREVFFLIGGAGSSFSRSHILDLFLNRKTKREVHLWYGARSLKENIYQEEYESLAKKCPNFNYYLVLSEPTKEDQALGWDIKDPRRTNYLFKAFAEHLKEMKDPEKALYYVCGPPVHNKSILELLDNFGVEKESIVLDDFGS